MLGNLRKVLARRNAGFVLSSALLLSIVVAGCGGSSVTTAAGVGSGDLNARLVRLPLGASESEALANLGKPLDRVDEGPTEVLNYGLWQLTFEGGQLSSKSTVRVPTDGGRNNHRVDTAAVLGLHLGESSGAVWKKFGSPESLSVTWEGDDEKVTVLNYGPWQLTFVNGRLEQRSG
jgi:hypothetical protein